MEFHKSQHSCQKTLVPHSGPEAILPRLLHSRSPRRLQPSPHKMETLHIRRLLTLASGTAIAIMACSHDQVNAPKPSLIPFTPKPASSHPSNSPDTRTYNFGPRDTTNGRVATGPEFGFRVKWPTVYKAILYDYVDQVAYAQNVTPPLQESHPVRFSGTIHGIGFSAPNVTGPDAAGPVTVYVAIAANDTLRTATRTAIGAVTRTATNPDGSPYYCGPTYGNACYKYVGTPGTITLERLNAEADLSADSTAAGYNSKVSFLLKSVPGYVDGQLMNITIDTTSWIPDADSLGGDYMDASPTGACAWGSVGNYRTCSRNIKSSGTLRVVGGVNGKYFEKTWHVSRTDAYPIVTPTKYFVEAAQKDTFTVRMSDGSAFTMSQWSWVADSGTAQTTPGCSNSTNPCLNTIIRESGWMRARVVHNFVFKYTRAHVTVGPPPRLQLTANKTSILLGETVNFSTSAGAAPYSITGWRFHKTSAASCGTNKTCAFAPPHSGRMHVFGLVDGVSDSSTVDIAVGLNSDGTGMGGAVVDSAVLDSVGAASLTIVATDGLDVTPAEGVHVFPDDSVVAYSFQPQTNYIGAVVVKDDTGSTATGTVAMSRSHILEGATEPDWLQNPDIVNVKNRMRQLLSSPQKKLAYASLLTSYSGLAARTSEAYADFVFMVADRLAFEISRADSTALRVLDDALAGTTFFTTACGDSVVFHPETQGNCQLIALRAAPATARLVGDSGTSIVYYVNGIDNTRGDADGARRLLKSIVDQTSFADSTDTRLFYNPTFAEQQKQWGTQERACFALYRRQADIVHRIIGFHRAAMCTGQHFVVRQLERDLLESGADKFDILYGVPLGVPSSIVNQFADSITPLLGGGRSIIFVAHSQGNMIVDRALRIVAQNQVLNSPPSRCTALLSLATPLDPDDFLLGQDYRRHLTVKHDILRQYGMNYPSKVFELNTPLSRQADSVLAVASQTKGPREMGGLYGHFGTLIHNAALNYFRPDTSVMIVKNRLTQLRQKCTSASQ